MAVDGAKEGMLMNGDRSVVPKLRAAGVKEEILHQIMYDNPRRLLAFVPKGARRS